MFDYLLDKITNASLNSNPYEYLYIENFLSDNHYDMLVENFHDKDWLDNIAFNKIDYFTEEYVKNGDRDHCYNDECDWKEYTEFLESEKFVKTICEKFQCKNIYNDIVYTVHEYLLDFPEHYIPLHEDSNKSKLPVFQLSLYLPDEDHSEYGTILYADEDGNGAVETAMKRNSALIYGLYPRTSWHGTKPGNRLRKSMLTRYRTTQFK